MFTNINIRLNHFVLFCFCSVTFSFASSNAEIVKSVGFSASAISSSVTFKSTLSNINTVEYLIGLLDFKFLVVDFLDLSNKGRLSSCRLEKKSTLFCALCFASLSCSSVFFSGIITLSTNYLIY